MTSTVQKLGEGGMAAEYYSSYRGLSSPEVSSSYAATKKKVVDDDDDDDVDVEEEQGDERNEDEENEREEEEELELGLSLGARKIGKGNVASVGSGPWKEYCRILTAKDFPSMVASRVSPNSSSASSSFSLVGRDGEAHPSADDGSHAPSQVVGWPPIRSYRMNNLFNQNKDNASENNFSDQGKKPISQKVHAHRKSSRKSSNNTQEIAIAKDKEKKSRSHFVKVNMDGMAIGRKVDLSAHRSYETLALVLEDMFKTPFKNIKASMLLDGSSEFVLTYEDKDGDWMLVGDVPWGMFLSSVRRLRIMRTSDANGLAPGFPPATA